MGDPVYRPDQRHDESDGERGERELTLWGWQLQPRRGKLLVPSEALDEEDEPHHDGEHHPGVLELAEYCEDAEYDEHYSGHPEAYPGVVGVLHEHL